MYGSVDYTQLVPLIFFSLYNLIHSLCIWTKCLLAVRFFAVICNYVPFVAAIIALTLKVAPYIIRIFFKWKQLTFEISPLNILTLFVNYATVSMYTTHLIGTHEFYTLFEKCCFCQLKLSQRCFGLKLAHWGTWQFIIRHLHISQNTPCLPPKILHKHCCKFLLGPRRNEKQRLSKILGDKQGVSWEWANSECR